MSHRLPVCLMLGLALIGASAAPASAGEVAGVCTVNLPEGFRPAPISALNETRKRVAGWMKHLGLGAGASPVGRAWVDTDTSRPAASLLLLCYDIPLDLTAELDPKAIAGRAELFVQDQPDLGLVSVRANRVAREEQAIQIRLVRTLSDSATETIRILLVRTPGRQAVLALEGGSPDDVLWTKVRAGVRVHSRADELPGWVLPLAGSIGVLCLLLLLLVIRRSRSVPRGRTNGALVLPSLTPGTGGIRATDGLPTFDSDPGDVLVPAALAASEPEHEPDAPTFETSMDAVLNPAGAEAVEAPAESGLQITRNDAYAG